MQNDFKLKNKSEHWGFPSKPLIIVIPYTGEVLLIFSFFVTVPPENLDAGLFCPEDSPHPSKCCSSLSEGVAAWPALSFRPNPDFS